MVDLLLLNPVFRFEPAFGSASLKWRTLEPAAACLARR